MFRSILAGRARRFSAALRHCPTYERMPLYRSADDDNLNGIFTPFRVRQSVTGQCYRPRGWRRGAFTRSRVFRVRNKKATLSGGGRRSSLYAVGGFLFQLTDERRTATSIDKGEYWALTLKV